VRKKPGARLIITLAIVFCLAAYAAYLCINYYFYNEYTECLAEYKYENGSTFTPLEDSEKSIPKMVLAAENDILKLYTNTKTTEVAVYDKRSGVITWSNPPDRDKDTIASGRNRIALNSQFMVSYYDKTMTEATMYNYDFSVEREQYEIEKLENGIRYIYFLGDLTSPTGIVPPIIKIERLEQMVLSKLDEKDARSIRNNYMESKDHPGFLELTAGIIVSKVGLQKMNKFFEQAGYTTEDFDFDAALAAGGEVQERTTFTISLEYRLIDDRLEVTIPTKEVIETGSGKICGISLLSFFGAGGIDEEGYILVPNGSGSLIYFNNGKKTERYNQYIYGIDETVRSFTVVEETVKARMPVFGIKKDKSAVFCEITNGDTLANILANVSGNLNSYNYVYPYFTLRGSEKVSMFGVEGINADVPVLEKNLYKLDLKINYYFLDQENANYSGMANYYRNKLIDNGILSPKKDAGSIPFYLDVLGGVKRRESFLVVPYMGVYPMTKFNEAQLIVNEFQKNNIRDIRVNYLGWFNGGYYHDVAKTVKVDRVLGGRKGLGRLNELLSESGGRLYGDVAFQSISFESGNFNWRLESARYYSGFVVAYGRTNPATLRTSGMGYIEVLHDVLSPKYLVRHIDKFLNTFEKINIDNLSLRDLGDIISSDKHRTNIINRQEAKQIITHQLGKLNANCENLMINGGNAYTWAYASDLIGIPGGHNPYHIVDEEIPFYQMVIHGCIDYTSRPINLSGIYDKQDILLKILEYGVAPRFTLSYRDSSEIKYTGLNILYSTHYETWLQDAVEIYHKANEVLKHVAGSTITRHFILDSGVRKIVYDNGCVIYINRNSIPKNIGNITIPANGYALEGV
jgi:hypothetical protein